MVVGTAQFFGQERQLELKLERLLAGAPQAFRAGESRHVMEKLALGSGAWLWACHGSNLHLLRTLDVQVHVLTASNIRWCLQSPNIVNVPNLRRLREGSFGEIRHQGRNLCGAIEVGHCGCGDVWEN